MKIMKVLIIGGVAAGATTAARLRRLNKDVEMIVFEKGNYVSYANCGLPYYVSGEIQGKDDLLLMTPQLFYDRFQIDVRVASEVTAIHPENKSISVYNHMTGETYEENYDQLVLRQDHRLFDCRFLELIILIFNNYGQLMILKKYAKKWNWKIFTQHVLLVEAL